MILKEDVGRKGEKEGWKQINKASESSWTDLLHFQAVSSRVALAEPGREKRKHFTDLKYCSHATL